MKRKKEENLLFMTGEGLLMCSLLVFSHLIAGPLKIQDLNASNMCCALVCFGVQPPSASPARAQSRLLAGNGRVPGEGGRRWKSMEWGEKERRWGRKKKKSPWSMKWKGSCVGSVRSWYPAGPVFCSSFDDRFFDGPVRAGRSLACGLIVLAALLRVLGRLAVFLLPLADLTRVCLFAVQIGEDEIKDF